MIGNRRIRQTLYDRDHARAALFDYIELFYNCQ
jgi:hypothetical protein